MSLDQTAAILAHEQRRKQGKLIKDLTGVGIFAIFIGIVSIVASNWRAIPPEAKLLGHFVLNAGVAWYMLRVDELKRPIVKDASVLLLFGLFLTFIALIGQIYQLHGDLHVTLLFWTAICTPFIWIYGRTYTVAMPWLIAVLAALCTNIDARLADAPDTLVLISSLLVFYLPPALLLASKAPWILRHREGFAKTFRRLGLWLPALFATCATFMYYDGDRIIIYHTALITLMALGMAAIFVMFRPRDKSDPEQVDLWSYLLISGGMIMLPFVVPTLESDVVAAALFVVYWIYIAWLGARIHSSHVTDWAIRLIVLRLFIVYLEVFGSMLMNGFGLVISGILLLVILKFLNKIVAVGRRLVGVDLL